MAVFPNLGAVQSHLDLDPVTANADPIHQIRPFCPGLPNVFAYFCILFKYFLFLTDQPESGPLNLLVDIKVLLNRIPEFLSVQSSELGPPHPSLHLGPGRDHTRFRRGGGPHSLAGERGDPIQTTGQWTDTLVLHKVILLLLITS